MAKKKNIQNEWSVVEYTDGLCGICHTSEVNEEDERIKIISQHKDIESASKAAEAHAKKKKLNYKF